ncbi:MAG: hypothetical protein GC192_17135 [Bacteroidetes bacterium]|nr:hypothetical protein [Bacteroidota bacterium]
MKSIFFSLLFALASIISVQAQDKLHIIVTNNTANTWSYKLGCASNGTLVNQTFAPTSTTEFLIDANGYQFPLFWGANDGGGCNNSGILEESSGPSSTAFHCTNTALNQVIAASSNGTLHLFVTME